MLLAATALATFSQNRVGYQKHLFSYGSVPAKSNLHSVFSLMSVNNEKNIRTLKYEMKWRRFVEVTKSQVKISSDNVSVTGDIFFRDFNFDTLITPDLAKITLSWKERKTGYHRQQQFIAPFPSVNTVLNPDHFQGESLSVSCGFEMSDRKYAGFVKAAGVVNHYYGFKSVLAGFKRYSGDREKVKVLTDYIEIHRALENIRSLNIINYLHLKKHDPAKFLSLYNKAVRLETRNRTLARQYLNRMRREKNLKAIFSRNLVEISVSYLSAKSGYQPYIAASYEKMASLSDDEETFEYYRLVCSKLDNTGSGTVSVSQMVFNEFIKQAERYEQSESYAYSLIMLDNAAVWAGRMKKVKTEPAFTVQLQHTIDGMLASYLKVASAGMHSGNRKMAERYIVKAGKLYRQSLKKYPFLSGMSLPLFLQTLHQMVTEEISSEHYQTALDLLFRFKSVFVYGGKETELTALNTKAYTGLYDQYITRVQTALTNGYIDEAYKRIEALKDFKKMNARYLTGDTLLENRIEKSAYGLILEFIQRGEILSDNGKNAEAMENYSIALGLQEDFLSYHIDRLDDLVNQNALPVLLDKIEQAELKVWANKTKEANLLYDEILNDVAFYHLKNNPQIKIKTNELKQKLSNRKCVDAGYALSNYLQVVQNRIGTGKWQEAAVAMKNADAVVKANKNCPLDTSLYFKLKSRYGEAVYYSGKYARVRDRLYAYGYASVWKELAALELFYHQHHLSEWGIGEPGLYSVVKSQHNGENVKMLVEFFLEHDNGLAAYRYLLLLRNSDIPKREIRELQIKTGTKLATQLSVGKFDEIVDANDKWLRPLIDAYHLSVQ